MTSAVPDIDSFLEEARGSELDRLLELDSDWKPVRLDRGRLRPTPLKPAADRLLACHLFFRSRSVLAANGLGSASRALRAVEARLDADRKDGAARGRKARLLMLLGRPQDALEQWKDCAGSAKEPAQAQLTAEAALSLGDVRTGLFLLDRVVAQRPAQSWPRAWRAEARRMSGDLRGAREDIDRALALSDRADPDFFVLSARLGRWEDLDRALALSPDPFWPLVHRGWASMRASKPGRAVRDFARVTELHPRCAWAWFWLALARDEAGDVLGARKDRERAIYLDPIAIWSYSSRAKEIGATRDFGAVIDWGMVLKDCDERIAADPADAVAYALRAGCREQTEFVLADHRRAIALDPDRAWFHALIARDLTYGGKVDEARREIEAAVALWPGCGWLYGWRGEVLRRQSLLEEAVADHTTAIAIDGENARAFAWRGSVRRIQGDLSGAREDFDRALELDSEYAWVDNERRYVSWKLNELDTAFEELHQAARRDFRLSFARTPEDRTDYLGSLKTLNGVLRRRPRCAWAWAWKGEALKRLARPRESLRALNKAVSLAPGLALPSLWRAEVLIALGRLAGARRAIKRCIALDLWSAWAYIVSAELSAREGRNREALSDLETFRVLSTKDYGASLYRAMILRQARRPEESVGMCDRLVAANPRDAWAYQERALARLACGDAARAYRDQRLAQKHEARQPCVFGIADHPLRIERDRLEWAIGELLQAKQDYWVSAWLGYLHMLAGRPAPAEKYFRKALRGKKGGAWAWAWLGELDLRRGRLDQAEICLSRARKSGGGKTPWIEALGGELLRLRGKPEAAAKAFDAAIAADPDEPIARFGLARLLQGRGDFAPALANLDCVLSGSAASAPLLLRRAELLVSLDRLSEAETELTRALDLHPDYAEAVYLRGEARRRLGRPDEALADLDRSIRLDSKRAPVFVSRGLVYQDQGRHREQLADFKRASSLDPVRFGALAGTSERTAGTRSSSSAAPGTSS